MYLQLNNNKTERIVFGPTAVSSGIVHKLQCTRLC